MYPEKDFKPVLRFMVVSDIHYKDEPTVERERFADAIQTANRLSAADENYNKLDALYVVGDFANNGSEIQMRAIKQTIDENINKDTVVSLSLASHEFSPQNGGEEAALERFTGIFELPYDSHNVINGYHFINVTCTGGCHFKEKQREWVKAELEKAVADSTKKPIFFFQHPHIMGTVYGSVCWGEDELTDILMNYPQIIDFSGHSHAPVNDPRSIHQRHFTCLGTGTLSYFENDEFDKITGTVFPGAHTAAQMLLVEADKDGRVRAYPYDLISGDFFPKYWKIDTPWEPDSFVYTDDRMKSTCAPYFEEGAQLECKVEGNKVSVTVPQAKDDEECYVDDYVISLRRPDGSTAKRLSIFSGYYFQPLPETVSYEIEDVKSGKYTVEVFANSFWRVRSKNTLKTEITVD